MRFPEVREFRAGNKGEVAEPNQKDSPQPIETPLETLEASYQALRSDLARSLLEKVRNASPEFFERLVVDVLVAMGYGGSLSEAGEAIGGSLDGQRAQKGVFITTSRYSRDAEEYVRVIPKKIVLIDGERLARLMIDHDVGVTAAERYVVKRLDLDYFDEGE